MMRISTPPPAARTAPRVRKAVAVGRPTAHRPVKARRIARAHRKPTARRAAPRHVAAARPVRAPTPYVVAEREIANAPFMLLTTTICESGPPALLAGGPPGATGEGGFPGLPFDDLGTDDEVIIGPPGTPLFPPDIDEPPLIPEGVLPPTVPPGPPPLGEPPVGPPPPPVVEPPTTAVPEPGTWLLMILGFGGVGAALRRRAAARARSLARSQA
ncbi:MAG: PEPxxWA-CTERM sorting domain-containing protein [Phenylobacterium sp.]|nr:PEPxxWA-CTERM sorting domain-containing protein [Phenylobacterium sp.]